MDLSVLLGNPGVTSLLGVAAALLARRLHLIPDVSPLAKPDAEAVSSEVSALQAWAAKAVTGAAKVSQADKDALKKLAPVLADLSK